MRLIPSGKLAANERKYPYIVELRVAGEGLDIELSRQIMKFHTARHIQPRHGRSAFPKAGKSYYRWCFSDLKTAQSFVERFGGKMLHE